MTEVASMSDSLIAVDLFSGMGGLSLGLQKAGFTVVGAIELETLAAATYRINHPKTRLIQQDVRKLSPRSLMKQLGIRKGQLDLLAGCPPCQGFSSMTTLNGRLTIDDERNDLITTFGEFVKALRPKTVLMENVPAIVNDERLVELLKLLEVWGYAKPTVGVLDAALYGVPQRRKRALLMASQFGSVPFPNPARKLRTVRDAISGLPSPGRSGDPTHDRIPRHTESVLQIIKDIPKDGGSRLDLGIERQLKCHKNFAGFKDVYGRMRWDAVSPTITSGCVNPSKGRFLHPVEDRSISLREAAILQSFPKRYTIPMTNGLNPAAVLVGNAFPPEFAKRQAIALKKSLRTVEK